MFRFMFLTFLMLSTAMIGGTMSVWYALNTNEDFSALRVGPWTAYPKAGTPQSDPYSTARRARDAELPLGSAEGQPFIAREDSEGGTLSGRCNYVLEGSVPSARFWTLHATDTQLVSFPQIGMRDNALHSQQILRRPDGTFQISIGPFTSPGNWIHVAYSGPVLIVLTLYDTPVTGLNQAVELRFPEIKRADCV